MKIVVADDLPASALDLLRAEAGWVVDARPDERLRRSPPIWRTPTRCWSAARPRSTQQLLAAAPRLRIVARAGTGVDNVDVAAASAPRHPGRQRARRQQHQRRRARLRADAGAGARRCPPPTGR